MEQRKTDSTEHYSLSKSVTTNDLVFSVQRVQEGKLKKAYQKIKQLDDFLNSGKITLENLSWETLKDTVVKLTLLYGKWICNFKCPNYCYTKGATSPQVSVQVIKKLIQKSKSAGTQFTYWPGTGELTLLPEFWELMQFQADLELPAIVFTNGSVFVDELLCQRFLGVSCSELLRSIQGMPNIYFYVKMWSTDADQAKRMTGVTASRYPYTNWNGLKCPKAIEVLWSAIGQRVGLQCMVTRSNFDDYVNCVLPFCIEKRISLFSEPIILSGNAQDNEEASHEVLTNQQFLSIAPTLASGASYCHKRQFGELIIVGDKVSPGIAIPPQKGDVFRGVDDVIKIFFSPYFRQMRKQSDEINGCLCRSYWENQHNGKSKS